MVAANKLLHLLEVFSNGWFLFSSPLNHHLVFFLLEVFNNIIQYQFDGKSELDLWIVFCSWMCTDRSLCPSGNYNLVYGIIRKRSLFHQLANLPADVISIQKALQRRSRSNSNAVFMESNNNTSPSEGAFKTTPVQTGTLNASLKATPGNRPLYNVFSVSLQSDLTTSGQTCC